MKRPINVLWHEAAIDGACELRENVGRYGAMRFVRRTPLRFIPIRTVDQAEVG